jgi:phosphatidylserine decarboxylase
MIIHKEGRVLLIVLFIVLLAANAAIFYFWPERAGLKATAVGVSVIFYVLILQFFRSPLFAISTDDLKVLAPADGRVVVIEETEETEFLGDRRKQVSIFMSPVNVHVNRSPVHGIIKFFRYHPGKYLVAWHPKSSSENERTTIVVETADGVEILVRQIAGALARRIKCYVSEGQKIAQGEEFGFIKFGSRVDVFLPLSARVTVNIGDKTKAGKTVIAQL